MFCEQQQKRVSFAVLHFQGEPVEAGGVRLVPKPPTMRSSAPGSVPQSLSWFKQPGDASDASAKRRRTLAHFASWAAAQDDAHHTTGTDMARNAGGAGPWSFWRRARVTDIGLLLGLDAWTHEHDRSLHGGEHAHNPSRLRRSSLERHSVSIAVLQRRSIESAEGRRQRVSFDSALRAANGDDGLGVVSRVSEESPGPEAAGSGGAGNAAPPAVAAAADLAVARRSGSGSAGSLAVIAAGPAAQTLVGRSGSGSGRTISATVATVAALPLAVRRRLERLLQLHVSACIRSELATGHLQFTSDVRTRTCLFISVPGLAEPQPGMPDDRRLAAVQNVVTQARAAAYHRVVRLLVAHLRC